MFESPNLDGMMEAELLDLSLVLDTLRLYARAKAQAMQFRSIGMIQQALQIEEHCETLYKRLPQEYRW